MTLIHVQMYIQAIIHIAGFLYRELIIIQLNVIN